MLIRQLHVEPATVALAGAAVALLITTIPLEKALSNIEWPTLFFFVALFVMVGALEETGAIDEVASFAKDLTGGDRTAELIGIIWISAVGSGVVDNIPFTTAMLPVVSELQGPGGDDAYWWALALGACFGGNATLDRSCRQRCRGRIDRASRKSDRLQVVLEDRAPGNADQRYARLRLRHPPLHTPMTDRGGDECPTRS